MTPLVCRICGAAFGEAPEIKIPADVTDPGLRSVCVGLGQTWIDNAVCPACDQARSEREERAAQTAKDAEIAARLARSGLPLAICEDYDPSKGNAALLAWMRGRTLGSVWVQSVASGRGKTRTCAYLAWRIVKRHHIEARFVKASEVCARYAAAFGESGAAAEKIKNDLIKADLLIIDDLGKGRVTPSGGELLFELFDRRTENKARMWVTSNLNGEQLEERLGEYGLYIRRRMRENMALFDADTNTPIRTGENE